MGVNGTARNEVSFAELALVVDAVKLLVAAYLHLGCRRCDSTGRYG